MTKKPKSRTTESRREQAKKHAAHIAEYQKRYRAANKEKLRAYGKEYRKTHPPKPRPPGWHAGRKPYLREFHLMNKYGMTEAGYQELLASQGGLCAICGTDDPRGKNHNRLHVDHCHKTGKVRGLLCSRCNVGIGSFLDDVAVLQKAITYLKSRTEKHVG